MLEELREIDTTAIKKLVKIKKEQERLVRFRSKADEMKDTVDNAVYQRVLADYESRASELENEAEPLKAEARGQYEKLCLIYDRIHETLEQVRAAKVELEFRHAVGELDKTQLAEKLSEPDSVLKQCQSQLGDADQLKAQFHAAFHSVEELEDAPQAAIEVGSKLKLGAQREARSEAKAEVESKIDLEAKPEAKPAAKPEVKPEVKPTAKPEVQPKMASKIEPKAQPKVQSQVVSKIKSQAKLEMDSKIEPEPQPKVLSKLESKIEPDIWPEVEPEVFEPETSASESSTDKTFVRPSSGAGDEMIALPQAKIVVLKKGKASDEYPLGVMSYIGRAPDNDIRIKSPTVSRKHALVTADAKEFTLKDLGSLSGTFVNEKKVTECTLADGDRIKVGDVELVFRSL